MAPTEVNVVWLQVGGCTGCSVSLLNSARPSVRNLLIDQLLPGVHVSLSYHPTLMAGQGEAAVRLLDEAPAGGFVLAVEGSVPEVEEFCTLGAPGGGEVTALAKFLDLAPRASLVLAVGTCSSFGGIPAGAPNPGAFRPVRELMEAHGVATPLVCVPGCPPHPDWVTAALLEYLAAGGDASAMALDGYRRPLSVYGQLIHENCPRRPYFDEGKFAEKPGDPQCLHKVGCKGPITYADCPLREWNDGLNWCVKAGAPCQGCTQPEFIDQTTPIYKELEEDRLPKIGQEANAGGAHE
jgi:hydrogenase small subunit